MQTKFDIGDEVFIVAGFVEYVVEKVEITHIEILKSKAVVYSFKNLKSKLLERFLHSSCLDAENTIQKFLIIGEE